MQDKERIEGLVKTKALQDFKTSVNTIIVDMTNEGWEYEDATEYMLSVINGTIRSYKNKDVKDSLIGKRVVVIDETQQKNNVKIFTISDFEFEGVVWFEEETDEPTIFQFESEIDKFVSGTKAYIHYDEISIQLID